MKNVSFILWKKLNGLFGQPNRVSTDQITIEYVVISVSSLPRVNIGVLRSAREQILSPNGYAGE